MIEYQAVNFTNNTQIITRTIIFTEIDNFPDLNPCTRGNHIAENVVHSVATPTVDSHER